MDSHHRHGRRYTCMDQETHVCLYTCMHVTERAPTHAHRCNRPRMCVHAMGCACVHACAVESLHGHIGVCTHACTHTYDMCSRVHRCLPATLPVKAKRSYHDRVTVPRPGSRLGQASAAGSSISSQPTVTSRSSLLSVTSPPSPASPAARLSTSFCFLFLTVWWNPPEASKGPSRK